MNMRKGVGFFWVEQASVRTGLPSEVSQFTTEQSMSTPCEPDCAKVLPESNSDVDPIRKVSTLKAERRRVFGVVAPREGSFSAPVAGVAAMARAGKAAKRNRVKRQKNFKRTSC